MEAHARGAGGSAHAAPGGGDGDRPGKTGRHAHRLVQTRAPRVHGTTPCVGLTVASAPSDGPKTRNTHHNGPVSRA
eukprot:10875647-Alexandrium_andersonii.AAC.1